ncbi:hypothetical protein [Paenarthrobacter sp. NPDC018779]|uniref:hypothetical protein n=1 Tax=Paenarthrobacter sp. NPDC018779 TaxID=3364375 RepID=UPI0037C93243
MVDTPFVAEGLERLKAEAFREGGPGDKAQELVSTSVIQQSMSRRCEDVRRGSQWGFLDFSNRFSTETIDDWLLEVRSRCYSPGVGTWVSYRVFLYPDAPGRLEVFDEEILTDGLFAASGWNDPSDADTLRSELLAFPRTVDNIPEWMWTVFRAEGVTPPIYNPELKTVDYDNKRRPVTDRGTDFSVEPTVIDPSLESGVLSRIGKKLFGSRS